MADKALKDSIKEQCKSVTKAAEMLGVHYTHLYQLINRKKKPSYDLARKMEDLFGQEVVRKHFEN